MSQIKNVIAGLGIVASFSVALAPLATYADDPVTNPNTVTANINTVISMKLVSSQSAGDQTIECTSYDDPACSGEPQDVESVILPGEADLTNMFTEIYVSTNNVSGYTLTLADSDNNANLQTTAGATIAPTSSEPESSTNPGWAVRIDGSSSWLAMPAANAGSNIVVKTHQPNPAAVSIDDYSKVYYGVAISIDQASGSYTDTVVYTATTL